jgi:plastocyanin
VVVAFVAVGAARGDAEALAFAVVTLVAAALTLVRRGLLGRVALTLIAVDTLAWMAPAALANATGGEQVVNVAVPAVLCVLAAAVLLLAVGMAPTPVLGVALFLLVGSIGTALTTSGQGVDETADTRIVAQGVAFSPRHATVREDGALAVANRDLFWHTLTIPALGINVRIPTGATRVVRIAGTPGTYRFVCAIPGHESAGMDGLLTVG